MYSRINVLILLIVEKNNDSRYVHVHYIILPHLKLVYFDMSGKIPVSKKVSFTNNQFCNLFGVNTLSIIKV